MLTKLAVSAPASNHHHPLVMVNEKQDLRRPTMASKNRRIMVKQTLLLEDDTTTTARSSSSSSVFNSNSSKSFRNRTMSSASTLEDVEESVVSNNNETTQNPQSTPISSTGSMRPTQQPVLVSPLRSCATMGVATTPATTATTTTMASIVGHSSTKTQASTSVLCSTTDSSMLPTDLMELIRDQDWSEIEYYVTVTAPYQAAIQQVMSIFHQKTRCYPLRYLCKKKQVPERTLRAVVTAFPSAVYAVDSFDRTLPLHVACWFQLSLECIQVLIQAYPDSIAVQDAQGNTPLHYAASFCTPDVVEYLLTSSAVLLQQQPQPKQQPQLDVLTISKSIMTSPALQAANMLNQQQQSPLHRACLRADADPYVLRLLLQASPQTARIQDWQGRCPLHDAAMSLIPLSALHVIVQAYPEAVHMYDRSQLTPYGILRLRHRMPLSDPRLHCLRNAIKSIPVRCPIRMKQHIQFAAEDLCHAISLDHVPRPGISTQS